MTHFKLFYDRQDKIPCVEANGNIYTALNVDVRVRMTSARNENNHPNFYMEGMFNNIDIGPNKIIIS